MFGIKIVTYRFLGSLNGGSKKEGQQREMATDLSKFLYLSTPSGSSIDLEVVISTKAVEAYVEELRQRNVGPSGIIAKLNTLCFAQTFLIYR